MRVLREILTKIGPAALLWARLTPLAALFWARLTRRFSSEQDLLKYNVEILYVPPGHFQELLASLVLRWSS